MVRIRPATPEDVEAVAELLYISELATARVSIYDFLFPASMDERLEGIGWLYLNGYNLAIHYSKCKVAEIDGQVASLICTFTREDDKLLNWLKAFRRMGFKRRELLSIFWRIRFYIGVNIVFPKKVLVIGNIATQRAYEKAGFKARESRTSRFFERKAGCPGFTRMTLTLE